MGAVAINTASVSQALTDAIFFAFFLLFLAFHLFFRFFIVNFAAQKVIQLTLFGLAVLMPCGT